MQQFIPFEDEWDVLETLRPEDLVPYQVGLLAPRAAVDQCTGPSSPSTSRTSPACAPMRRAVPAESSST